MAKSKSKTKAKAGLLARTPKILLLAAVGWVALKLGKNKVS